MPIEVNISVNGKPIKTVHIARMHSTTLEVNEYSVVVKDALEGSKVSSSRFDDALLLNSEWVDGKTVYHTAGDGLEVLVEKAFKAIND